MGLESLWSKFLNVLAREPLGGLALFISFIAAIPPVINFANSFKHDYNFFCEPINAASLGLVADWGSGSTFYIIPECDFENLENEPITVKEIFSSVDNLPAFEWQLKRNMFRLPPLNQTQKRNLRFLSEETPFQVEPNGSVRFHHFLVLPTHDGWDAGKPECERLEDGQTYALLRLLECNPEGIAEAIRWSQSEHARVVGVVLTGGETAVWKMGFESLFKYSVALTNQTSKSAK